MLKTMVEQRGDVNYEDIMTLFRQENRSPQLTKVASTLYEDVSEYIKKVRKESEREIAMNPSSHASMMLNDQLKKAIERSKRVYELRQRKIALLALRRCAGDNPSTDNLTPDELVLFSSLTSVLGAHKDSNADFEDFGPKPTKQEPMVAVPEAHPKAVCEAKREAAAQDPDFGEARARARARGRADLRGRGPRVPSEEGGCGLPAGEHCEDPSVPRQDPAHRFSLDGTVRWTRRAP